MSTQQHVPVAIPDRLVRAGLKPHDKGSLDGFGLILRAVNVVHEFFKGSGPGRGERPGTRFDRHP
jgi:hypothetical protein